jgi:Ca-activated chloride channel family protein
VLGLPKDRFSIYEDKNQEAISHFSTEDTPISMGVIFDSSASMSQKLALTREAIVRFLLSSNPQDEFFHVAVNTRPKLRAHFTSSVEEIQNEISKASPKGETSLLDAVYFSLGHMRKAKNERKGLLIVSDGQDNHSRYTTNEVLSLVREAGVQVYAMGIADRVLLKGTPAAKADRMGMQLLASITDVTGGRVFRIRNLTMMGYTGAKLATELRNQYLIAYRPNHLVRDGGWRRIKVRVNPPQSSRGLSVYAKAGYYAPAE